MSLGLDIIGADTGAILSTVFSAAGGAVDYAKHTQESDAAAASAESALAVAIAADRAATDAVTKAALSAMLKGSSAKADKVAADAAVAAQDSAGALVPEEKRTDRVKDAQEAVDNATKKVSHASGTVKTVAQVRLDAAKQTLAKTKGSEKIEKTEERGLFSKVIHSGYTWLVLVAAAGLLAYKKFHK